MREEPRAVATGTIFNAFGMARPPVPEAEPSYHLARLLISWLMSSVFHLFFLFIFFLGGGGAHWPSG